MKTLNSRAVIGARASMGWAPRQRVQGILAAYPKIKRGLRISRLVNDLQSKDTIIKSCNHLVILVLPNHYAKQK
jgi:hypothetical protein